MAGFRIPFFPKASSPSSKEDLIRSYLVVGNELCSPRSSPLTDKLTKEIKEIYTKCKVILDAGHRKDTPLILASRLGLAHMVWGFVECARQTDTDLHTSNVGQFQQFLGHRNWIQDTALHVAATNNAANVVNILLNSVSLDQLISYRNDSGKTALFLLSNPKYVQDVFAILDKAARAQMELSSSAIISMDDQPQGSKEHIQDKKDEHSIKKNKDSDATNPFEIFGKGVKELVARGLEEPDSDDTILHQAAKLGEVKRVKDIIEKHPSMMYHRNSANETPAYVAAQEGHLDILVIMINYFQIKQDDIQSLLTRTHNIGSIMTMTHAKENVLHRAIKSYHPGVVFWLTKYAPKLASQPNEDNESPLYIAAHRGHGAIVKLILENCTINISREGKGDTALHAAARSGSAECVRYLLSSNNELLYKRDQDKHSVLYVAVSHGHLSVAKALLDHDSSIGYWKHGTSYGAIHSVIHCAVEEDQSEILELLLSKCPGCEDITDEYGNNILHVAVLYRRKTITEFIFQHKSLAQLINQKNNRGNTPIHLLLNRAFDTNINKLSEYFRSDQQFSELEAMKFITDARVDLGAVNNDSETPITIVSSGDPRNRLLKAIKDPQKWKINEAYLSDEAQRHFSMMDQIVVVAALIATASFAAAFAVPGGFDGNQGKNQGMPVLLGKEAYKAFVITNALAFICSCCVLYENIRMLLNRYTQKKILEQELDRINGRVFAMYVLIGMAMITMAIAFMTGTYVVLTPSLGFAISLCSICLVIFVSTSLFSVQFGGLVHKIMNPIAKEKITGKLQNQENI